LFSGLVTKALETGQELPGLIFTGLLLLTPAGNLGVQCGLFGQALIYILF